MAGAVKYTVTGAEEVAAQFRALGLRARDLAPAFQKIGAEVASDAKSLAPRISGRLAADIRPTAAKTRASIAVGRASVPYAGPIHYGWRRRNIEPNPFLKKAADTKAEPAADEIVREMKRLIKSVGLG